jgi:hypothetical protein
VGKSNWAPSKWGKCGEHPRSGEIWRTPSSYGRCDGPTIGIEKNVVNTPGVVEIILWTPRSWRKKVNTKKLRKQRLTPRSWRKGGEHKKDP